MDISIAGFRFTLGFLSFGLEKQKIRKKTHNYTQRVQGCHYFLSPAEDSNKVYMIADGDDVKRHDYILLKDEIDLTQYQVEVIEHHSKGRKSRKQQRRYRLNVCILDKPLLC